MGLVGNNLLVQVTEKFKTGFRCPNYDTKHLSFSIFVYAFFSTERTNEGSKMASNSSRISFLQLRNTSSEFLLLDISRDSSN